MIDAGDATGPNARQARLNWRLVSLAIVAAGVLLVAGANAHLVYVAVISQPDCVLAADGGGAAVKFKAAKPAC